jgi:hypothetical protein
MRVSLPSVTGAVVKGCGCFGPVHAVFDNLLWRMHLHKHTNDDRDEKKRPTWLSGLFQFHNRWKARKFALVALLPASTNSKRAASALALLKESDRNYNVHRCFTFLATYSSHPNTSNKLFQWDWYGVLIVKPPSYALRTVVHVYEICEAGWKYLVPGFVAPEMSHKPAWSHE